MRNSIARYIDNMSSTSALHDQLCFALHAASRAMTNAYRAGLPQLGLTYPQFITLVALWEQDGLTVSELGHRLHLDSGTLSPLLKRLEGAKLVERRRESGDERRVSIHLTPSGRDLEGRAAAIQAEIMGAINMTESEARTLRELAQRFTAAADQSIHTPR